MSSKPEDFDIDEKVETIDGNLSATGINEERHESPSAPMSIADTVLTAGKVQKTKEKWTRGIVITKEDCSTLYRDSRELLAVLVANYKYGTLTNEDVDNAKIMAESAKQVIEVYIETSKQRRAADKKPSVFDRITGPYNAIVSRLSPIGKGLGTVASAFSFKTYTDAGAKLISPITESVNHYAEKLSPYTQDSLFDGLNELIEIIEETETVYQKNKSYLPSLAREEQAKDFINTCKEKTEAAYYQKYGYLPTQMAIGTASFVQSIPSFVQNTPSAIKNSIPFISKPTAEIKSAAKSEERTSEKQEAKEINEVDECKTISDFQHKNDSKVKFNAKDVANLKLSITDTKNAVGNRTVPEKELPDEIKSRLISISNQTQDIINDYVVSPCYDLCTKENLGWGVAGVSIATQVVGAENLLNSAGHIAQASGTLIVPAVKGLAYSPLYLGRATYATVNAVAPYVPTALSVGGEAVKLSGRILSATAVDNPYITAAVVGTAYLTLTDNVVKRTAYRVSDVVTKTSSAVSSCYGFFFNRKVEATQEKVAHQRFHIPVSPEEERQAREGHAHNRKVDEIRRTMHSQR